LIEQRALKVKRLSIVLNYDLRADEASPAIWNRTVLATTRHRWTRPASTAARQTGNRFVYLEGM